MTPRVGLIGCMGLLLMGSGLAPACEPVPIGADAQRVSGGRFVLDWRADPAPLKLGEFFAVVVSACERSGATVAALKVDAAMPLHRHGMNYVATVGSEGAGRFRATGLLLHMPGQWEFTFDLAGAGTRETLRTDVDLR